METAEKIILDRLKQGDYFSFELVFKKYQPKLFSLARRIVKDEEKAHEIVHDVFIKLWENRKKLEIKKTLEAYLVVKTKSYCLNALRKNLKEKKLVSETDIGLYKLETEFYQDEKITQNLISENILEKFQKALDELPDQQQKILKLSRIDGLTAREIAAQTNITQRTVETHIYLALKTIKSKLQDIIN